MIRPTLEEAKQVGAGYESVPITMELFADIKTPIEVLQSLRAQGKDCCILENVMGDKSWGRYTFLGYEPEAVFSGTDGLCTMTQGGECKGQIADPFDLLREQLALYRSPRIEGLPPFTGGLMGYFSYDCVRYAESTLRLRGDNAQGFDDFQLMLLTKLIAFDHQRQKIVLIVHAKTNRLEDSYIRAVEALKDMERMVQGPSVSVEGFYAPGPFEAKFSEAEYCALVERAKSHIHEGEIFQVVLSNRFTAKMEGSLLGAYRTLRTISPSPYMVCLRIGGVEIACASPETLVSLRDGICATHPLAGTCRRGVDAEEDARLECALLQDEKELAEHNMLVDLGRNDLGKVCAFGTVNLREHQKIVRFSHVSHIASLVTGKLREGFDALDLLKAVLPAGTLSGAPKLRACQIIDELEGLKRGPYGGALGYIDFGGDMDLCIGMRVVVFT